ncbi:MAG: 3-deoxy-7-phosphoheptulonate synthase [Armatimonadetes bacterium]|jgi:3-deoxy-7-phosphoheptulonate synthase|nr:3-deoxy-7-phosphoheptulonate synthase [Armatimonadota bacterium]
MIIAMKAGATAAEIQGVMDRVAALGLRALNMPGGERTAIGIASAIPPEMRESLTEALAALPGVAHVTQVSRAYKLASREFHPADTVVDVRGVRIGGRAVVTMAGPCAIESREQLLAAAQAVKAAGAQVLRGGAFKPRTSPYTFQGLGLEGLKLLKEVGEATGMVTLTEVMDQHDVEVVMAHADLLQIGARNMQNFPLLVAVGKTRHPVVLKRGPSATIDEWLLSAEYLLSHGNNQVILCERGVHPLDRTYTRNTLDLSAVPVVKGLSHLPVVIDPSHAVGTWRYVAAMSRAAVAAGADGLLIEVHPCPKEALCDGPQALEPDSFASLMADLRRVAAAVGRG